MVGIAWSAAGGSGTCCWYKPHRAKYVSRASRSHRNNEGQFTPPGRCQLIRLGRPLRNASTTKRKSRFHQTRFWLSNVIKPACGWLPLGAGSRGQSSMSAAGSPPTDRKWTRRDRGLPNGRTGPPTGTVHQACREAHNKTPAGRISRGGCRGSTRPVGRIQRCNCKLLWKKGISRMSLGQLRQLEPNDYVDVKR